MTKTEWIRVGIATVLGMSLPGCANLNLDRDTDPPQINTRGLVNGYFGLSWARPFDGTILEVGVLSDRNRWGKIVSLDLWPIG